MISEAIEKRTLIRIGYRLGGLRHWILCDVATPHEAENHIPEDATIFYIGFSVQEFACKEGGLEIIGANPIPIFNGKIT